MSSGVKRHLVKNIIAGLCLGFGIAMIFVLFGVIALGTNAPFVVILLGLVIGIAWNYVAPARVRKRGRARA